MKLFVSASIISLYTMISRVLGLVRDIFFAAILGTGGIADSFFVAFRIPNLFRKIFGEGALNAAFVPIFSRQREENGIKDAIRFAEQIFSGLLFVLVILTLLFIIFMPWIMQLGFGADLDKLATTTILTRITFPYLVFISLVALLSGVLNSLGRFTASSAVPIVLNIVLIVILICIWLVRPDDYTIGLILAWAVTLAGSIQLIMLLLACSNANIKLYIRKPTFTPAVKDFIKLAIPGMIAGGASQINIFIGTMIAGWQAGAVSYLYYADRIYQFPMAIIGTAIGVALLPELSRNLNSNDHQGFYYSQNRAVEFSMLLAIPATVALIVIPEPIISALLERKEFTEASTNATSMALMIFAFGLPAFILIKIISPSFFAREDTKTPTICALISIIVNVILSLILFIWIGYIGIAVATSVSAWVNVLLLGFMLHKHGELIVDNRLVDNLPKIFFAAMLMGTVLFIIMLISTDWRQQATNLQDFVFLFILIAIGMTIYFIITNLIGVVRIKELLKVFKRG